MANLIGFLNYGHHAGRVHRLGHKWISSHLATWNGEIHTEIFKDGFGIVTVNNKAVWKGNINKKQKKVD